MVQLTKEEIVGITKRLQGIRQGLVRKTPFYAILLFGLRFSLDDMTERVYTDGERIAFNPDFLKSITDREVEFIMLHEVSHVALGHPFRRTIADCDFELYDMACDIVVNSNIYQFTGKDEKYITIKGKVMPHKICDKEGILFTVEQVYEQLLSQRKKTDDSEDGNGKKADDKEEGNGKKTDDKEEGNGNKTDDNEDGNGKRDGSGKIQGKDGKDGKDGEDGRGLGKPSISDGATIDDHSFWKGEDEEEISSTTWEARVMQTYETVKNLPQASFGKQDDGWGDLPIFAERMYNEVASNKLDWRTLLNDFIQEDLCDYSFYPPDRRFGDSDFFLPDFNEKDERVENLLFMIDTSGSMTDDDIGEVYGEIKSAIEQFDGKIKGWLGFFDASVTEPKPFESEEEFKAIRIQGGGGTSFLPIFHYVRDHMQDKNVTSIIILTDGYAPYPEEYERMNIPVLWIINNNDATPPWGMIARLPRKQNKKF